MFVFVDRVGRVVRANADGTDVQLVFQIPECVGVDCYLLLLLSCFYLAARTLRMLPYSALISCSQLDLTVSSALWC